MTKRLKGIVSLIIAIVLTFSFFTLSFSMSVLDGNERELQKEINSLPFTSFFTAKITNPYSKATQKNILKGINDPLVFLPIISGEKLPEGSSPPNIKEPDWNKIDFITKEDAEKLEKSSYIKDAFVGDVFTNGEQYLKAKDAATHMMFISSKFFNDLELPLEYGGYFTDSTSQNSVILTNRISKVIFGNENPIGKTVLGTSLAASNEEGSIYFKEKYTVMGVLKPLSNEVLFSTFGMVDAFTPLPKDFIPLSELKISKWGGDPTLIKKQYLIDNILYVLPEKGKYKEALSVLKTALKDKGSKGRKDISPEITSTNANVSAFLSIKSREEKIKYILYAVIFLIFVSIFTAISFLILELLNKKREISIKRAVGESKRMLFAEYFKQYVPISLISLFIALVILLILSPALKKINIAGSMNTYAIPISTMFTPHSLYIGWRTMILGIATALAISFVSVYFSLKRIVKITPAEGMREREIKENKRKLSITKIILVTIIAVSITGTLFPAILRDASIERTVSIYKEVRPEIIRITFNMPLVDLNKQTTSNFALGNPHYTYDDYLAVKKLIGNKGIVDFRSKRPEMDGEIRYLSATSTTLAIYGLNMAKGRFIEEKDIGENVCVVGAKYAKETNLSVGKVAAFHDISGGLHGPSIYTVIGIVTPSNPLIDETVFFPPDSTPSLSMMMGNLPDFIGSGIILIKANNPKDRITLAEEALEFLNNRHLDKNPGVIYDIKKYTDIILRTSTSLYTLLSIFLFLSLISAFLSLSALLFIEVIRRTREIGIKRAIGATNRDILKEFTVAGLKTTIIALVIGIPIGIVISLIVEKMKGWNYYIPVNILILVILVSLALGFVFSFLPALFASHIKPVEAIKSE